MVKKTLETGSPLISDADFPGDDRNRSAVHIMSERLRRPVPRTANAYRSQETLVRQVRNCHECGGIPEIPEAEHEGIVDLCQLEAIGPRQHAEAADLPHVAALGERLRRRKAWENLTRQIVVVGANRSETTDR